MTLAVNMEQSLAPESAVTGGGADLGVSLALWTLRPLCVSSQCGSAGTRRPGRRASAFSRPPHRVYPSVIKMPYAEWV